MEYQGRLHVGVGAKTAFDFLSNPDNVPRYVPAMARARVDETGNIHVEGDCPAEHFTGGAVWRVDRDLMRIHWDSQANVDYRGRIEVQGDERESDIHLVVSLEPGPDHATNERYRRLLREPNGSLQEMLDDSLQAIRSELEGEPRIERHRAGDDPV
ncbi:MAG TPA: hypothetical protein VGE01_09735 [Fimbriimonas sp.]